MIAQEERQPPEELFEAFWANAKRVGFRIWLLGALCRGVVWNAPVFGILIAARRFLDASIGQLLTGYMLAAVATAALSLWIERRMLTGFAEMMDERYQANGRITSAVEFVEDAHSDPYRRLAVAEAGSWIVDHPDAVRWQVPRVCYLVVPAGALLLLACVLS